MAEEEEHDKDQQSGQEESQQEAESREEDASLQKESESDDENTLFVEIPAEKFRRLQEKAKEREELLEKLRKTQADYENFRKRMKKKREEEQKYAVQGFVKKIIPVLDDFDLAIPSNGEEPDNVEGIAEGIRLIRKKFLGYLKDEGVSVIDDSDVQFDPKRHEASGMVEDEDVDQKVVKEIQRPGYKIHDRVIRPAQVLVAKPPENS